MKIILESVPLETKANWCNRDGFKGVINARLIFDLGFLKNVVIKKKISLSTTYFRKDARNPVQASL